MSVQWPLLIFSVLLGVSSGISVFLGVAELKGKFKEVRFLGALIALICLAVGGFASALHMGHPERVVHLLGNMSSGLSKELIVVALVGIALVIYVVLSKKDYPQASKIVGVAGACLGLILPLVAGASYLIAARPAWDSVTLPLMYLGVGLGMGMLLMAGLVLLKGLSLEEKKCALKLALGAVVLMIASSLAYVAWVAVAPYPDPTRSIDRLISGDLAMLFWLGVVVLGLVVPAVLTALTYKNIANEQDESAMSRSAQYAGWLFAALACSAIGAVCLRVIMYDLGTSVESFIY